MYKNLRLALHLLTPLALTLALAQAVSASPAPPSTPATPALLQRVQQYEQKLKQQPDHLALRQRLAELYFRLQKAPQVINTLAPYANEINLKSYTLLAKAYQLKKDYANEIKTWQSIIKTGQAQKKISFRPHYALAQAFEKQNNPIEAEKQYQQALQMAPKHLPSFNALFDLYFKQQDYDAAKQLVLEKIALLGERSHFLHKLCAVYIESHFVQEGVKVCSRAVQAQASHPPSHIYLAQGQMALKQEVEAEKKMSQAARKFSTSEFVQWSVGEHFYQKQQYAVAERYLQKAVQIKPQSARSLLALAMTLFQSKKYSKALPMYLRACKQDKTRTSLSELRTAIAYLRQNNQLATAKQFSDQEHICQNS